MSHKNWANNTKDVTLQVKITTLHSVTMTASPVSLFSFSPGFGALVE